MKTNLRPVLIAALFFGALLQTSFGIVSAYQVNLDPGYLASLKDRGIRFFQSIPKYEIPGMRYDEAYNSSHAQGLSLTDIYKNHMQLAIRFSDIYHKGWGRGGSSTPIGALKYDNKGNIIGVIDELNTVQAYCDFWLENYMKPMLKSRYEQGIYIIGVAAESYWRIYDTQINLTKLFPYHDFHEFEGLSDAAKEARIRSIIEDTHKKLYEWKNENYPKMIFNLPWAYTHSTENMLKCVQDIPWVDWFCSNGGGTDPMIGTDPSGPGGGKYHYPIFKQMIETDNFTYTNYDGTIETRQSRGWGIGNWETGWLAEAPGTPQQYLKLPAQYADTRYYDYEIDLAGPYATKDVFQKFASEYSALDRGHNYIKFHCLYTDYPGINKSAQNWHSLYPTTFIDNNLPTGARYHTDNQIDEAIEKTVKTGKLYVDNFSLKKAGVEISREGDFENVVPSAWEIRGIKDILTKISLQSPANGKTAKIFLKTSEGAGRHLFTDIKVYEGEKIANGGFELITGDQLVAWQGNLVDWIKTSQGYSAVVASGADCYQDIVLTPGLNYNFYCVIQNPGASIVTGKVTVIHYCNEQIIEQQDYTKARSSGPNWVGFGFTFLCPANATRSRILITSTDATPVIFDLVSLTGENLIVNGKFQDGKNGWSPDSELLTNGATTYLINGADMDSYQDIAIQSNKDYSASYIIRNGGSAYQGGCVIKFYDSQGLEITNSQLVKAVNPITYVAHAEGLGANNSRGLLCTDGCQLASQICGSNLGICRLDFTVMAKGEKTYSQSPPWLGVYWEGYNSAGGILQKGKALSAAGPDGKFWHIPVTNSYQSYGGYIQTTNNNVDYVKVYIYSTDWKNYAGFSRDAGLMAAAHCFNGPYGYDESTNTFVYTNKITGLAESACVSKYTFMKNEMHTPGGRLYDVWGGLQWPLVVKGENISYDPDTGHIKIIVRNVSAENSLSAPVHVFARNKTAGPAWDTSMYIKAKPENIQNSLILASRIAYNPGDYAVPGPTATTDDPLTSGDNALELTFMPSNTVSNGQRIYVYIEDTPTVKGWTAFNDLPECFISITESNEYLEITAQAADENGISRIELEYSLDGGANWDALTSVNADSLSATFNKTVCAVAFRVRALDAYNLSSRWVYASWSAAQVYVNNNSSATGETGSANAPFKSIQKVINMAGPETQILVAKGIYRENLLLKDNIELIGAAADLVVIESDSDFVALVSSADNVLIENIAFNGINGIKLDSASNIRMRNCIFDVENTAIEMTGNASALVENITIGGAGQGILAGDGSLLDINHSIITAGDGIVCSGGAQCVSSYNNIFCVNQNYIGTSAGTGDISVNPLYSDNDIADYYALKERSSCWTNGYRQLSIGWQRINLTENFGFELGTEGWSANPATLEVSTASFAGNKALKVTTPGINLFEGLRTATGCFVEQGKTYTASAYVKGAGQVKICLYSAAGGTYAQNVTTLNSGWQKISVTRTITQPAETLSVHILTWDTAQAVTFYADNVELMENQNYKMLYNGSFELGTKGWASYRSDNPATLEISDTSLVEDYALKVTTPGISVLEGVKTATGNVVVEQGKTYTASAYVKGQGQVKICLYSAAGWTYAQNVTTLNSGWQKISVTRTISQTNEALGVYILTWDTAQAVTFYVDDIQLKEENLVGYWQFDEENPAIAKDSSWRGNHGVLYGSPQWSGDAFSFDGIDDYIDCGTNASLKVSEITMEAWVYSPTTNFSGWNEVAGAEGAYGLDINNNLMRVHLNTVNQGWHWCAYPSALTWDGWHHVAFTYDGVSTVKCYRDGDLIFTDVTSSSGSLQWADWTTNLYIGQVNLGSKLFKGSLDDVKIFDRALSDYEIRSHFREKEENINLVGCWQFEEGDAAIAKDSSWEGNDGVLYGSPQWIGDAFSFDRINDYIDCGTNASLKVSEITMEAWVYSPTTNFSGWNEVAGAEGAYGLDIYNNRIYPHINTVNQGWHWCQYSDPLSWDGWHQVAFTYDGVNTVKCYRDGELILTDVTSSSGSLQWVDWASNLYIGQVNMGAKLFNGSIDDVKLFNRALSDYEIGSHFRKGRKY